MAGSTTTRSSARRNKSPVSSFDAPSAALIAIAARPRHPLRRPIKQVSYELANHAKAYLEGHQFASGYDFLSTLLTANTSISTPALPYIGFLAPTTYLSLASSLVAYPPVTTKAQSSDAIKGADAALHYLQCIQTTIDDPAYPLVRKALSFADNRKRLRTPAFRSAHASPSPEPSGDVERLAGPAANKESLWHRAEDFWHIVGWAFNCSVVHKKRWGRWKLWLSVTLDFLEADWDICVKQSEQNEQNEDFVLRDSLIWHYIAFNVDPRNRTVRRRIAKSVFAMATPESLKEFHQVWEQETAVPKQRTGKEERVGDVDFKTGAAADYDGDEEMQDAPDEIPRPKSASSDNGHMSMRDAIEALGGTDAINLRQRFIALLTQVSTALPSQFTTIEDLFDNILEQFDGLPIMFVNVLLSTFKIPGPYQVAFGANLLRPLCKGKIPSFFNHAPTQSDLEKPLLALNAASQSFVANAKVSFILEHLFLYLMSVDALTPTNALRKAMETGIEARHGALGTIKNKKGNTDEEEQAKALMEASSERLLGMFEVLEMTARKHQQPRRK